MLMRRVIACLDVRGGRVVKGTRFLDMRDVGDPVDCAARYESEGADEVVVLDIDATAEERGAMHGLIGRIAERLFIPLTVGGGVRSVEAIGTLLRAGADKVAVNSAAIRRPSLLTDAADRFGRQCVVASIDARRDGASWRVWMAGGRVATDRDAVEWARECEAQGAGEILLTSIDRDGTRGGYDLELTAAVTRAVNVPVIASGGGGSTEHVVTVFRDTGADAALLAGVLHERRVEINAIKSALHLASVPVRGVAA